MRPLRAIAPFLIFFAAGLLEGLHFWLGYKLAGGFSAGIIWRGQEATLLETYARVLPSWSLMGVLAMAAVALTRRFPITPQRWGSTIVQHMLGALVFGCAAVAGNTTMRWFLFVQPEVGSPNLAHLMIRYYALYFNTYFIEYWGIVGVYSAILFYRGMRERELAVERLARGLSEARLAALQSQLQPHFLFNTLTAISALAGTRDYRGTVRAIGLLSELLRMSLRNPGPISTLGRELRFARGYLELQRLRFPDRLQAEILCAPDLLPAEVPALLLQPLIENAVRYGIARNPESGRVSIEIARKGQHVRARIHNTLRADHAARHRAGIGLNNVQARLMQLYDNDFGFEIDRGADFWAVTIEWPLRFRVRPAHDRSAVHFATTS